MNDPALAELVTYAARLVREIRRQQSDDLPVALLRLLSLLDELGPSTVTQLARADAVSQPTMTANVTALVERDWGSRQAHPTDSRATMVTLSPAGSARLQQARAEFAALLAQRLGPLQLADVEHAVAVLRQIGSPE